jgi:pSer/pThr/pTyr-binding forkhead associated (FHA) protein
MLLVLQNVSAISQLPDIVVGEFPFVIGRGEDNQAQLPLAFISRRHCEMTLAPEGIQVQDLESQNGTFVNGRKAISPILVHDGDEISLGSVCFRAVMSEGTTETADCMPGLTVEEVDLPAVEETRYASPSQR